MSVHCNITVQFQVRDPEELSEIAGEQGARMARLEGSDDYDRDAARFLDYMQEVGRGVAPGPRGDMFTWGSLGNYSCAEVFVESLVPFWRELYARRAVFDHDGVVVMFQQEQRPYVKIAEISMDRTAPHGGKALVVRELETSFPLFGWYFERPEGLLSPGVRTDVVCEEESS